jgi:hypothetical protein
MFPAATPSNERHRKRQQRNAFESSRRREYIISVTESTYRLPLFR